MGKNPFINAVAAAAYIALVSLFMFYGPHLGEEKEDSVLMPMAMISLLVFSVAMMGYIFALQPIRMYLDGDKAQAVRLFVHTVGIFGAITLAFLLSMLFINLATPAPVAYKDLLQVESPGQSALVTSPLEVRGRARGPWYFEASFPLRLQDAAGNELAVTPATAQGEWTTEEYVPFSATLTFTPPGTPTGFLVFEKDNPSGLPEHADSFVMPVRFSL